MTNPLTTAQLGRTGPEVTSICAGGSVLGSMPSVFSYTYSEAQAIETVLALLGSGINFLDTSAGYSDGESERRIGLAIAEAGGLPEGFIVASKADPDPRTGDFSGAQVRRCAQESLARLGLEQLPLYYLHDPERMDFADSMRPDGPVAALVRLREEGIVGAIGVAGGPVEVEDRYLRTDLFDVLLTHNRYTLLDQSAGQIIAYAHARGMGVVNAAPFGGGILAKGSAGARRYAYQPAAGHLLSQLTELERLCRDFRTELAAVALQFSLRDPRITSTVVTMSSPARIRETLALAAVAVPGALWSALPRPAGRLDRDLPAGG